MRGRFDFGVKRTHNGDGELHFGTQLSVCWRNYETCVVSNGHKKSKIVPVQTVKAYTGSGGIAPLILNVGTRWR